jgi:hypothetical protein
MDKKYFILAGIIFAGTIFLFAQNRWKIENMTIGSRSWRCRLVGARCPRERSREREWENRIPESVWRQNFIF